MNEEIRESVVSIDGKASRSITPDQVELSITFEDWLNTKEECIEQYNKDIETVFSTLESCGIDRKTIKQSGFKVYPRKETAYKKYGDDNDDYYKAFEFIEGYKYMGSSLVMFPAEEDIFGTVWLAMLKADGKFTYNFEYGVKDEAAVEAELLKVAFEEARTRANILAHTAGVELGLIKSISHSFRNAFSSYGGADICMSVFDFEMASKSLVPDFNPEDIEVECSVSAAWYLEA